MQLHNTGVYELSMLLAEKNNHTSVQNMYLTILQPPRKVIDELWPAALAKEDGFMEDNRALLAPTTIPFIVIAVVSVAVRIFARWRKKCLGFDDLLIVISLAPAIAVNILLIQQSQFGLGMHIYDAINTGILSQSNIIAGGIRIYIILLASTVGHVLVRLSILISFYRVFSKLERTTTFRVLRWYLAFFVISAPIAIFADAFQCTPAAAFWDTTIANGNCSAQSGILVFGRVLNCVNNFVIFILPLSRLWRLRLPGSQRVGLAVVFGLGFVVCVLSTVKLALFIRVLYYDPLYDYTWHMVPVFMICSVENIMAIVCSCAPVLRHYIDMFSCFKRISPAASLRNPSPPNLPVEEEEEEEAACPHAETSGWYEDAESVTGKQLNFWSRQKSRSTLGTKSVLESLSAARESSNMIWPLPSSPPAAAGAPMARERGFSFSHASASTGETSIGRRGSVPRLGGGRGGNYRDAAGRRGSAPSAPPRPSSWEVQYRVEISQRSSDANNAANRLQLPTTPRHTHNPSRERRAIGEAVEMMNLGTFGVLDDCDGGGAGVRCIGHGQ